MSPVTTAYVEARCNARRAYACYQTKEGDAFSKAARRAYSCSDRAQWPELDRAGALLDGDLSIRFASEVESLLREATEA